MRRSRMAALRRETDPNDCGAALEDSKSIQKAPLWSQKGLKSLISQGDMAAPSEGSPGVLLFGTSVAVPICRRRPRPDKGKPAARRGRKATGQVYWRPDSRAAEGSLGHNGKYGGTPPEEPPCFRMSQVSPPGLIVVGAHVSSYRAAHLSSSPPPS